ncbi:MAG: hypothetical protein ACREUC_22440 [Steroidobacteraceae bacterium]
MHTRSKTLTHKSASLLKALLTGAAVIAALAIAGRADANSHLCAVAGACERDPTQDPYESHDYRFATALQRGVGPEYSVRRVELSDQDFSTFSGVGMISCTVNGTTRSATAFLVGAFDIGVTVAHMFEKDVSGAMPTDCFYNSMDSLGQVRERIPVSYVRSQWEAEADAFGQPAKDLAVVRLSQPSRYAQRTMPLGRFSGDAAPVVMVGYRIDLVADTMKHKARGTVYERRADGLVVSSVAGFTHDMDARGIAPGAPVIDERTGVIIGIHTRLPARRNAMITMNDWLEATLRTEIQAPAQAAPN